MAVPYNLRNRRTSFPSQSEIQEVLNYDYLTGIFTWKKSLSPRVKVGQQAGSPDAYGYVQIMIGGRNFKAHRLAWVYVYGSLNEIKIDHKDENKSNNAIFNLRKATNFQNSYNRKKQINNTSGFKGVCKNKDKFTSRIRHNGINYNLGTFTCPTDAALAYDEASKRLHGEFSNTNFQSQ